MLLIALIYFILPGDISPPGETDAYSVLWAPLNIPECGTEVYDSLTRVVDSYWGIISRGNWFESFL